MKTLKTLAIVAFLFIGQNSFAQAKSYQETVVENPTANEDLKVVSDYLDALVNNKMAVVESLLSDGYVGTGPSDGDTETKAEHIANWKEAHKVRTNEKNEYVTNTFRVLDGDLKGDWVSTWGTYSFREDGKDIVLPYQFTADVKDGKIQRSVIYYDNLAVVNALGYTITPPEKN